MNGTWLEDPRHLTRPVDCQVILVLWCSTCSCPLLDLPTKTRAKERICGGAVDLVPLSPFTWCIAAPAKTSDSQGARLVAVPVDWRFLCSDEETERPFTFPSLLVLSLVPEGNTLVDCGLC